MLKQLVLSALSASAILGTVSAIFPQPAMACSDGNGSSWTHEFVGEFRRPISGTRCSYWGDNTTVYAGDLTGDFESFVEAQEALQTIFAQDKEKYGEENLYTQDRNDDGIVDWYSGRTTDNPNHPGTTHFQFLVTVGSTQHNMFIGGANSGR